MWVTTPTAGPERTYSATNSCPRRASGRDFCLLSFYQSSAGGHHFPRAGDLATMVILAVNILIAPRA